MHALRWLVLALIVLLAACSQAEAPSPAIREMAPAAERQAAKSRAADNAVGGMATEAEAPPAPAPAQRQASPMLIRNASVIIQVPRAEAALTELATMTARVGGYLSHTQLDRTSTVPSAQATARVPEQRLEAFLRDLDRLGEIQSQQVTSEDVGEEYTDLQSRIRNWQVEEQRLLQLYARAGRISDLLEVEQEISRVRGEIEQATGRARYLANRAALSTVTVTLTQQTSPAVPAGWSLPSVLQDAASAFVQVFLGLVSMLIWVLVFVPLWGPLVGLGWWLLRRRRRARQDRKKPPAEPPTL